MRKYIFILGFFFISLSIFCQRPIFYDSNWKRVRKNKNPAYYRTKEFNNNLNAYLVQDYYITGEREMAGYYTSFDPDIKNGDFTWWYRNGQQREKGKYLNNFRDGIFYEWDSLGSLISERSYQNGHDEGEWKEYYPNGQLKNKFYYQNDKLNGKVESYFENGNKLRVDYYKNDLLISGKCYTKNGDDTTYYPFYEKASFKGGEDGFRNYITSNLWYPIEATDNNIQGTVYISFVIDTAGNLIEEKVIQSSHEILNKSALSVVRSSPKWKPGRINGELVRMSFIFPVVFIIK